MTETQQAVVPEQNLSLWNSVIATDPNYTKHFSKTGGFAGTAINFTYTARKATAEFGPMGIGWGAKVISESYRKGAPIGVDGAGVAVYEITHIIRINLWYKHKTLGLGEIESYGQTTYVGKNKNGLFTDEEAPKKSMTDAISKGLSWLGFGADIHLGLYEDSKYVEELKEEFGDDKGDGTIAVVEPPPPPADVESLKKEINEVPSTTELRKKYKEVRGFCEEIKDSAGWLLLNAEFKARGAVLAASEKAAKKSAADAEKSSDREEIK